MGSCHLLQTHGILLKRSWVDCEFHLSLWLVTTTHTAYEEKIKNFKTKAEYKFYVKRHSDLACCLLGTACLWLSGNFRQPVPKPEHDGAHYYSVMERVTYESLSLSEVL